MAIKVKTQYLSSFNMPPYCVACGNSPGAGTKKVSASKSTGNTRTTLTLELPLCQECYQVSKTSWFAKLILCMGVLMSLGLGIVVAYYASLMTSFYVGMLLGGVVLLVAIFLAAWLSNLISQMGMIPEQRERRRLVGRSVRISGFKAPGVFGKGWVSFKFENPTFASEFCRMNLGEIV